MGRKKTPETRRKEIAKTRRTPSGSALVQLQFEFLKTEALDAFREWRMNPLTMLMVDCVRELSSTPPVAYIDTDEIGVQYGVSSGLSLAASFMDDPRVMYDFLFSGAAPGEPRGTPPTDYTAEPETAQPE